MEKYDLLQMMNRLGYPLFENSYDLKANETIAEMVKSGDLRLWEGFPVVLANVSKDSGLDVKKVKTILKNKNEYEKFFTLFLISLALYKYLHLRAGWVNKLYDSLKSEEKTKVKKYLGYFKDNEKLKVFNKVLDGERLKNTFNNYFNLQDQSLNKVRNENYEELSLEYAMSQIFTARQKEIFLKRVHGKKMTKTEREYFYRVVKKKAIALTNRDLHLLAQKAIA